MIYNDPVDAIYVVAEFNGDADEDGMIDEEESELNKSE